MELSEAIKNAIDLFGKDVLLDSKKLINILSDYHAFNSPSHKHVLSSMLEEGYGAKFISHDALSDTSKRLFILDTIKAIENNMGFQHEATVYIVDSVCRALNWPKSEDCAFQKQQENLYKPNTEHNTGKQSSNRQVRKESNYTKPAQHSSSSAASKQNSTNSKSIILAIGSIIIIIIVSIFFINQSVNGGHIKFEQEFGNMQSGLISQELDNVFLNRDSVNADSLFIADLSFGMKPESIIKNLQIYGISYGIDPGEYPTVASLKNIIPNSGKVLMRTGFDDDNQLRYLSFKLLGSFESVRKYCEKQLGNKYVEIVDPMRDIYCYWFKGNQCVVLNNTTWHGSYLEISDINYNPDSLYEGQGNRIIGQWLEGNRG